MSRPFPARAPHHDSAPLTATWMFWGLVVPLIFYAARMVDVLARTDIPFDSLYTYLPLARQLLEDSSRLFDHPDSYKVAPGAVVYMALAGANPVAVKTANLAISLTAMVLTFDAARRMGGRVAAVAAGWLYALPHMLVEAGATLMGESPFIFVVAVWLWATGCAAQPRAVPAAASGRAPRPSAAQVGAVVLAGLALASATLTRATYMYWLPFAVVAFLVAAWRLRGDARGAAVRIAVIHLIATLLVGAYMVRQNEAFGRPMVATGSGAALYFGSNPVLSGYEPPFFGLAHDESTIVGGTAGHLSMEGDRRLMEVAKTMLRELPTGELMKMYVRKLGAVLFFSRAHLDWHVMNDRAWRVVLVLLAVLGFWGSRRHLMGWVVGGAAAYQCAVHVPVLYNPRYSISALDILFVLLAAQGVAWLWSRPRRRVAVPCAFAAVLAGIAIGAYHQRHSRALLPDFALIPPRAVAIADGNDLHTAGWDGDPFRAPARMVGGTATVEWAPAEPPPQDMITLVHLGMPRFEGRCNRVWLFQRRADGAERSALIRLAGLRQGQDINWGMHHVILPEGGARRILLRFECDPGTLMQFDVMGLYQASPGRHFRQQALGE
ncbi:hypothetical protein [Acidovorax sp. NCPPB 4044]|uniref:hypothetical protein n=1 Tax=Acidovorax sp. NCPPB 4044 TaxID=2940490 RepID=UPI002304A6BC|nr:hypothetical protein [Acidovorax sp. NCPPB 4044]MDA8522457.1 hypothetical protein [Acidovorax sp. NCPPB 4044]